MRTIAIGILAAAGLALAVPANADSVSVGVGGVGVGVHEHDGFREHRGFHDRAQVVVREREHARHCKVVIIHRDGMTKKIKRCG